MILNFQQEKILKRIYDLGSDHIFNNSLPDKKSQAAIVSLIRLNMIAPHLEISPEDADRFRSGQSFNPEKYALHFALTEDGRAYYEEMYKEPYGLRSKIYKIAAVIAVIAMFGIVAWS